VVCPDGQQCDPTDGQCLPVDGEIVKVKVKVPRFINPKNRGVTPIKLVSHMDVKFDEVTCGDAESKRLRQKYLKKHDVTLAIGKFKTKDLGIACGDKTLICTGTLVDGTKFMGTSNKFKTVGRNCWDKHKDCHDDHDRDRHDDHDKDRHDDHDKDRHDDHDKDRHDDHDKDRHDDDNWRSKKH
jgi:hypothetical protein